MTPEEAIQSNWWPTLLATKDTQTYAQLSKRFGVNIYVLRKSLEMAGQGKVSMPRGPKPKNGASGSGMSAIDPQARLHLVVGQMSDAEAAAAAAVSVDVVKQFRRDNKIQPFLRAPAAAPAADTSATRDDAVVVRRRRGGDDRRIDAPAAPAATATVTPAATSPARSPATFQAAAESASGTDNRAPASPLASFHDRLGKIADAIIAEEAGVSRSAVVTYRQRHGIPAWEGYKFQKKSASDAQPAATETPAAAPAAAAPTASSAYVTPGADASDAPRRRGRPSAIAPFADLVGKVPDSEIAAMAGVTIFSVQRFRAQHGIPQEEPAAPAVTPSAAVEAAEKPASEKTGEVAASSAAGSAAAAAPVAPAPVAPGVEPAPAAGTPVTAATAATKAKEAAPASGGERLAFAVTASNGTERRRFVVTAGNLNDAVTAALSALAKRDGGYRVKSVRELAEVL